VVAQGLPTEPEPLYADATLEESVSQDHKDAIDFQLEDTDQYTSMYWTGPWPLLHITTNWQVISDVVISLHFTINLLMQVNLLPDGTFDIFVPMFEANGYTQEPEINDKIDEASYHMLADTERSNPWSRVDEALLVVTIAGLFWGLHAAGTIAYVFAFGYLVYTLINAIAYELNEVEANRKDRLNAGLDIIYRGLRDFLFAGEADLLGGLALFMLASNAKIFRTVSTLYGSRVPYNPVHDAGYGAIISAIALLAIGFGLVAFGILYSMGLI
jgi:hypothetical protein